MANYEFVHRKSIFRNVVKYASLNKLNWDTKKISRH